MIRFIALFCSLAGFAVLIFSGHELIRITGPGNIGGNSIRSLLMLQLMAVVFVVVWIALRWITSPALKLCLILLLLNLAYIIGSFLYSFDYYRDQEAFLFKHKFPDDLPPPISNYLIVVTVNLLLLWRICWLRKRALLQKRT